MTTLDALWMETEFHAYATGRPDGWTLAESREHFVARALDTDATIPRRQAITETVHALLRRIENSLAATDAPQNQLELWPGIGLPSILRIGTRRVLTANAKLEDLDDWLKQKERRARGDLNALNYIRAIRTAIADRMDDKTRIGELDFTQIPAPAVSATIFENPA